jgi:F-type H+-transporting ATPase subunit b
MNFIDIAYASESAETTAANEGFLGSMGINAPLFCFQLLNFGIVLAVLWFLLLKPLAKKLSERQTMIDNSIENSKKIEEMLKKGELGFQEKIDMAKSEAGMILERAKIESDALADQSRQQTRTEIESLVETAKKKIESERVQMAAELKEQTAEIVIAALQKILPEKIDGAKDKKIIAETLSKLNYEKK